MKCEYCDKQAIVRVCEKTPDGFREVHCCGDHAPLPPRCNTSDLGSSLETELRKEACDRINALVAGSECDNLIQTLLHHEDPRKRSVAAVALRLITTPRLEQDTLNALTAALSDRNALVRLNAAFSVWEIEKQGKDVITAIIRSLPDQDTACTLLGLHYLERIVARANHLKRRQDRWHLATEIRRVIPSLIALLQDAMAPIRMRATSVIKRIGPEARESVTCLARLLQDTDAGVRKEAARALCGIGSEAKDALPMLSQALSDEDQDSVRWEIARALAHLGKVAVPFLVEALEDGQPAVCAAAAAALEDMRCPSKELISGLIQALNSARARARAARALGAIGSEAAAAVPHLLALLDEVDASVQWEVRRALQLITKEGSEWK